MGYNNLYERFHLNEPWDSPNNQPLLALMPDVFRSPGDGFATTTTRLQTFTGPNAPFGSRTAGTLQAGPKVTEVTDGTSNTIMFVETGASAAVPWTKPADVPLNTNDPRLALGNLSGDSFRAMMFDAVGRRFFTSIAPATLAALATHAGGEAINAATHTVGATTLPSAASNLKQIVLAMLNAQSAQLTFPANRFAADGTPLLSWRVSILPYLGLSSLYNQFHLDEPWDSPHNLSLLKFMPSVFRSADDPLDTTLTHVMTFVGPGAPFPASGNSATRGPTPAQITDGSASTYMFVEAGNDVAAPWTKPVDLPYHAANPYSHLGALGTTFYAAYFNGAVLAESASLSISQLTARITHQGGSSPNTPPAAPYIRQSQGDARLGEFGADWFDVVFDAAPATPQTLLLSVSAPSVAFLDKQSLVFDATNWNVPQRVIVRGVDNFDVNADQTVTVTVGPLQFTARVVNDDAAAPSADFNADGMVDGGDFLAWQRGLGNVETATLTDGDADNDGAVTAADVAVWRAQFSAPVVFPDFDASGAVDGGDLLRWQRGLGASAGATFAQGDATGDGAVGSDDLAAWAEAFGQVAAVEQATVAAGADESALVTSAATPLTDADVVDAALAAMAAEANTASIQSIAASRRARYRVFAEAIRRPVNPFPTTGARFGMTTDYAWVEAHPPTLCHSEAVCQTAPALGASVSLRLGDAMEGGKPSRRGSGRLGRFRF